jgi:hypothetical protein
MCQLATSAEDHSWFLLTHANCLLLCLSFCCSVNRMPRSNGAGPIEASSMYPCNNRSKPELKFNETRTDALRSSNLDGCGVCSW